MQQSVNSLKQKLKQRAERPAAAADTLIARAHNEESDRCAVLLDLIECLQGLHGPGGASLPYQLTSPSFARLLLRDLSKFTPLTGLLHVASLDDELLISLRKLAEGSSLLPSDAAVIMSRFPNFAEILLSEPYRTDENQLCQRISDLADVIVSAVELSLDPGWPAPNEWRPYTSDEEKKAAAQKGMSCDPIPQFWVSLCLDC